MQPPSDYGSLIYTAAYHGNVRHLKKLLSRHASDIKRLLNWKHPHGGATAIYVACEFGHVEAVKLLLEAGAPVDQPREDGATPLYKACQDGNLEIVRLLLKQGAKVDQMDSNSMTALWVACHQGRTDLARVLLEAKADPQRKVQDWSPIMLAERENRTELVELLRSHLPAGAQQPASFVQNVDPKTLQARRLYHAATHNDERAVRGLLETTENAADVNAAPGEGGATALYAVCVTGNSAMVQLLLDCRCALLLVGPPAPCCA